jgi:hypothetical protein
MTRCFGPAIGHHQYRKASPVDTTPFVMFSPKFGIGGGHTLSPQESRCLVGPNPQEVTVTFYSSNGMELRVVGIIYKKGASLD